MTGTKSHDDMAADFIAAHERLIAGKPRVKELKARAAAGNLKVNISTVALEAGHSRTLIALEDCRFPVIRARILGHNPEAGPAQTAMDTITALRATAAELRQQRDNALAEAVGHLHARRRAERHAAKWKQGYKRLRDERLRNRGEKVVHLLPSDD